MNWNKTIASLLTHGRKRDTTCGAIQDVRDTGRRWEPRRGRTLDTRQQSGTPLRSPRSTSTTGHEVPPRCAIPRTSPSAPLVLLAPSPRRSSSPLHPRDAPPSQPPSQPFPVTAWTRTPPGGGDDDRHGTVRHNSNSETAVNLSYVGHVSASRRRDDDKHTEVDGAKKQKNSLSCAREALLSL